MTRIMINTGDVAQWQQLVCEAEASCELMLDEEMESYLVFLLMRHLQKTEFTSNIMGIEFLRSLVAQGQLQQDKLRDVGDQCLMFSGFFPKVAEKRLVKASYYVNIGVSAYHSLADTCKTQLCDFYHKLAEAFVSLMDILQVIRNMSQNSELMSPIAALELWGDTHSQQALNALKKSSIASPCIDTSIYKH